MCAVVSGYDCAVQLLMGQHLADAGVRPFDAVVSGRGFKLLGVDVSQGYEDGVGVGQKTWDVGVG